MGTTSDAGTPGEDDARAALAGLVRDLRTRIGWHRRGGTWAAPGGESPRSEAMAVEVEAAAPVIAAAVERVTAVVAPAAAVARGEAPAVQEAPSTPAAADARPTLAVIREELGDCRRCKLCSTRKNIVFGVGPEPAALMFVGEAPGADEDRLGDPFVGRAGELLDRMIEAMGWERAQVYIANVLKCRPPNNRNPEPDEVAACRPFLDAQIQAVRPRVIVTLGRPAANVVLGNDAPISALRGRFHEHRGVRVMPTFHPAFLLRQPDRKRDTWADLKQVIGELERLGVQAPRPPRG
ncbi:MAG TPA: uracil-DNA glycosylase [Kofleriaceae bacterium]|nr:uracil-DNA glycosylase [Kofleriaceae bacterium]